MTKRRSYKCTTKSNRRPPASFVCPLTMELMEDPVMDLCAHNFERCAIEDWLRDDNHSYCPISRKPLTVQDLIPNDTLAERIDKYKWQQENPQYAHYNNAEDDAITAAESEPSDSSNQHFTTGINHTTQGADEDGVIYVDVEMGEEEEDEYEEERSPSVKKNSNYRPVVAAATNGTIMLLPQERQVLNIVRTRAAARRLRRRKRMILSALLGAASAVAAIAICLLVLRALDSRDGT